MGYPPSFSSSGSGPGKNTDMVSRAGRQRRPRPRRNYSRFAPPTTRGSVFCAFSQREVLVKGAGDEDLKLWRILDLRDVKGKKKTVRIR